MRVAKAVVREVKKMWRASSQGSGKRGEENESSQGSGKRGEENESSQGSGKSQGEENESSE